MNKFMLTLMGVVFGFAIHACDACGCNIGGDGWGVMPNYTRHFAGIRLQYRTFHNTHAAMGTDHTAVSGNDYFFRSDIVGRFALTERLQLMATLPYRYNERVEENYNNVLKGMGDASLTVQYLMIKPGLYDWKHALQLSIGGEAPTGKFTFSHDIPATLQTGSGTWDWMAGINYTIRYRNAGLNIEAVQRFNGHTSYGYDWGNSSMAGARAFYTLKNDASGATWMPWTGVGGEYFESNIENMKYNIRAAYTGGYLINWNCGLDYYSDRIMTGVEAGLPLINELSDGSSFMRIHTGIRLIFFIQSKKIKQ